MIRLGLFLLGFLSTFAPAVTVESQLGHDLEYATSQGTVQHNRFSLTQRARQKVDPFWIEVSYRAEGDTVSKTEIALRRFTAETSGDWYRISLGLQEVTWGETFGVPIVDIVNPRDLTQSLLYKWEQHKLPLLMAYPQFFWNNFTAELIFVPLPRQTPLAFPVQERQLRFGKDAEFGGRIGYLFENGWDLKIFYYNHWNRSPALSVSPLGLKSQMNRVDSVGGSFSFATSNLVFRGDTVYSDSTPFPKIIAQSPVLGSVWQTVLGTDYTSEGQSTVGVQLHIDHWNYPGRIRPALLGLGVRYRTELFRRALEPEIFLFTGINNRDRWIAPKLTWNATANLKVSGELHWLTSSGNGYPILFAGNQTRFFSSATLSF